MMVNIKKLNVKDVMREAETIGDKTTFKEALSRMICKKTNSLIVVDEEGKFIGTVNARTLIHKSIPSYLGDDSTAAHFANETIFKEEVEKIANDPIVNLMDENVMTVKPNESLMKAAMIVSAGNQIRIPVLDEENRPIGLLTRTELKQVIGLFLEIEGCFSE